ncbi:D,D-heptose 7-phosphate kinase [Minicystis rosea]|nr:D,D-heptose 7-phosphate kinase [Minicystis rosea]
MTATSPVIEPVSSPRRKLHAPERRAVVSAPMRVSLAGGGSDLPPFLPGLGGRIVGTAIDLRTRALVEPFDRGWVRLELSATGLVVTRRRQDPRCDDLGARLLEQALALTDVNDGVRLRIETDVVPGAGLGGSASAAVAALAALHASIDGAPDPEDLVRDAVRVERDGLSLACGSQDQTFAAHGGLLDLRFDERGLTSRTALAISPALLAELAAGMLLVDTGERRVSGEVIGRARYPEGATAELVAAAGDVALGLEDGHLSRVIAGMRRSAVAKIARDPTANADAIAIARRIEPLGAEVVRMCGAGGGGHVLVWAPEDRHPAIVSTLGDCVVRKPALAAAGVRLEEA